jgi:hypothetical protein
MSVSVGFGDGGRGMQSPWQPLHQKHMGNCIILPFASLANGEHKTSLLIQCNECVHTWMRPTRSTAVHALRPSRACPTDRAASSAVRP